MSMERRTRRSVLRDKSGVASSITELLGSTVVKAVTVSAVGGVILGGLVFWSAASTTADVSSSFQNANVSFEKAVRGSDVVVGVGTDRIGLLKNVEGERCEVQTWQAGDRDGKVTLQVDTSTIAGECTPETPLVEAGAGESGIVLAYDIEVPAFAYSNLGGREITFDASAVPTLTTGTKPDGVKQGDFDDVRPHKVTLSLKTLSEDTAASTKHAVATGYTNVLNVAEVNESTTYVPSPSEDPIPGPLKITAAERSSTVGAAFAGAREGVAITFNGGVCAAGPTKVDVSYVRQAPSEAPVVNTVVNAVLTGEGRTVDLGDVPNGSSGLVEVAASCVDGGVVVKDSLTYTQPVPATTLSVVASPTRGLGAHDLSWVKVSSLPTAFDVFWAIGAYTELPTTEEKRLTTTDKLAYQADAKGANVGASTTYVVVATVDSVKSPPAHASIMTAVPSAPATSVSPTSSGATWTAVSCPTYTTAQYSERHYQQAGTSTAVNWTTPSSWSTARTVTGITTPSYGRTVYEVMTRCVSTATGAASAPVLAPQKPFYVAETVTMTAARSTTVGTVFTGAREGAAVTYSGGRCYGGATTKISVLWTPQSPSGQTASTVDGGTSVLTGGASTVHVNNVRNGAVGTVQVDASCPQFATTNTTAKLNYSQAIPKPILTVKQGSNGDQHVLSWTQVSSLPTTFGVYKTAEVGFENQDPDFTTALTQTLDYVPGTNYGNLTQYSVSAMIDRGTGVSDTQSITTPWPTVPKAQSIAWTKGTGNTGTLRWSYLGTCPAGTTLKGQQHENRTGQSNGTFNNSVRASSAWASNPTSYAWKASYALNGYAYAMGVDSKCVSNVTNLESTTQSVQSPTFVMPMVKPAKPVWDAFNFRDNARGTNRTYSTCFQGGCPSMQIDYKTFCSAGSTVGWSNFSSTDWNPATYNHPFGWQDNWHLAAGSRNVTYHNAKYSCKTPWATSAQSDAGNSVVVTVMQRWW